MALRARKPKKTSKRVKMLLTGQAGVGKTTTALQFPRPYYIDTERGATHDEYVELLEAAGGAYMGPDEGSTDLNVVLNEVYALNREKHDFHTIVIDSLNTIYQSFADRELDVVGDNWGANKKKPDQRMRQLLTALTLLDMNVVMVTHRKANYVQFVNHKGKQDSRQEGYTFEGYKATDYLIDIWFELVRNGGRNDAIVKKSRIKAFTTGEVIEGFSYDAFADLYGREHLERDAESSGTPTKAQLDELKQLMELTNWPKEDREGYSSGYGSWLTAAGVSKFREMDAMGVQQCIDRIKDHMTTPEEVA